jgi:hypothetical protein
VRARECGTIAGTDCQFTSSEALATTRGRTSPVACARRNDCSVGQFRYIGAETNSGRDVFEAACTNRPDGVYAILPAQGSAKRRGLRLPAGLEARSHLRTHAGERPLPAPDVGASPASSPTPARSTPPARWAAAPAGRSSTRSAAPTAGPSSSTTAATAR